MDAIDGSEGAGGISVLTLLKFVGAEGKPNAPVSNLSKSMGADGRSGGGAVAGTAACGTVGK